MLINISIKPTEEDIQEMVCSNTSMLEAGMTLYMHDEQHFTHKHMTVFKLPYWRVRVCVISEGST